MAAEVESSSLDDFFAKKDKKKTKKSKVLSELNTLSQVCRKVWSMYVVYLALESRVHLKFKALRWSGVMNQFGQGQWCKNR